MTVEYLGNKELLELPQTAFLASSKIPVDLVLKCYDWATQMAKDKLPLKRNMWVGATMMWNL
jgi:hypothetical protein